MSRRHPRRSNGGGRFARLPLTVLVSPAVVTLDHAPFRVLVLLAAQFTGYNNGQLALSKTQAAEQNITNKTLYKALAELETRGLIEETYGASRVPPRPTMYALCWLAIDDTVYSKATRVPSHSYREYQPRPKRKRARRPRLRVVVGENTFRGGMSTPRRGNEYTQGTPHPLHRCNQYTQARRNAPSMGVPITHL
jgi:hypothetical protein